MKQVIENLQRFIQARRDYYEAEIEPVTQQPWSATTWGNQSTGWLSIRAGKSSMAHTEISRMKGFESQVIADRDYVDFIKAVVVHQYEKAPADRKPSPQSLLLTHLTLKRIYAGLRATRQQTNPIYIDTSVFQYIDETLVSVGYKNVFDAMTNANTVQRLLIQEGLTLTAPQYEHKHTADNKKNRGKVARKAVKEGVVDDRSRDDDEQRLITFAALKGFAAITTSPRHYWEELGCRVVDLLFCTGLRGDEVLFLPRDCWVTRPLQSKETGMPLIAVDGSPMEQHGIRYYAEKHAENRIHWFESNAAPIARRAYLRILELTNPFHQHARWIVESGGKHILNWNESTVTESDLINHIIESNVRYTETKDKRPLYQRLQNGVRSWVKARKFSPIGFQTRLGVARGTVQEPIYSFADVEEVVRSYLPDPANPINYEFLVGQRRVTMRIDELLIVGPSSPLGLARGARVLSAVQPMKLGDLNAFIGGNAANKSVFDVREYTEENGGRIEWKSHHPRHNLNTFLALAGVSEHLQAMIMGRMDITQNRYYQHLTENERQSAQKRLIEYRKTPLPSTNQHGDAAPEGTASSASALAELGDTLLTELVQDLGITKAAPQDLERPLRQAFHAFDTEEQTLNFVSTALDADVLVGELQNDYNLTKTQEGPEHAQTFIETHGRDFHLVVNGACTRNLALHGCPKKLKCLQGGGCGNLLATGRPGELEGLERNYTNMAAHLEQLERHQANDPAYEEALQESREMTSQMKITVERAREARDKNLVLQVFPSGLLHNVSRPETLADRFAAALPDSNQSQEESHGAAR